MIKCVIFDFDGVIAESVDVKTEAFKILFKDYPEHLETIAQFHIDNGGMSRYEKFRFIYKNIIDEALSKDKFIELCNMFSELVVEKVVSAPFVEGVPDLLDKCFNRFEMFIVSGTPDEEIKKIVRRRELDKYFREILGSPTSKTNLVGKVLKENNYNPKEVIFIGDSRNDLKAAVDTGTHFIARIVTGLAWTNHRTIRQKFKNMSGVFEYIEAIT
jgi:phosphoglycolate phosphatase-like HAD superfamily hydrolase